MWSIISTRSKRVCIKEPIRIGQHLLLHKSMEEKPSVFLNLVFLVAATNQQGNGSLKHHHFAQFNSFPPVLLLFSSSSKPNQGSDAVSNAFRIFPPSTRSLAGDLFFYMMCFQQNLIISTASTSMRQWFKAA